jgi:ComF family protein
VKWFKNFLHFFFPESCKICQKSLTKKEALVCEECFKKLPFIKIYCSRCGTPLEESLKDYLLDKTVSYCSYCETQKFYFDKAFVAFFYKSPISEWINEIKFGKNFTLAYKLGLLLNKVFKDNIPEVDLVIPLPLSLQRLRERGFNQSFLITWGFLGKKPSDKFLKRTLHTKPQAELSQKERWKNVKNAFLANDDDVKEKSVLIIDDVMTTGATLNEAAKALKNKGAKEVYVLAVARSSF